MSFNDISSIIKSRSSKILEVLIERNGFLCDVYFPVDESSVYNGVTSSIQYSSTGPDIDNVKMLLSGIIGETDLSLNVIDPFFEEVPYVYFDKRNISDNIPNDSLIVSHVPDGDVRLRLDSRIMNIGNNIVKCKVVPI